MFEARREPTHAHLVSPSTTPTVYLYLHAGDWTAVFRRALGFDAGSAYNGVVSLWGYCDADYADCPDTRRSISGFVITMNGGAVSWTCRKQTSVALSTLEAEAVALRVAICEVIALKFDMEVIDPKLGDSQWIVHEDNQSLIAVVNTPDGGKYEARKHIAVRVMWLREIVSTGIVKIQYVGTKEQVADVLTKALPAKEFAMHRESMMDFVVGVRSGKVAG